MQSSSPTTAGPAALSLRPGDVLAGVSAAAVVLPQAMAFGVALLAPAGVPAGQAALFGLVGAALLSAVAGVIGRANALISAPTGPAMVLLAGTVGALLAAGASGAEVLTALAAMTVLAGLIQLAIGISGGGTLVKYIPYPVIAGFTAGSALLMLKSQLAPLSGAGFTDAWVDWRWLPGVTALATVLIVEVMPRWLPTVPGVIGGLIGGTALFHLLAAAGPGPLPAGWLIGQLPGLGEIRFGFSLAALKTLPWGLIVPGAIALALLAAINTLLVAVVTDVATRTRHQSARELIAQGVALAATGMAGGMAGSGTTGATVVALRAGGRRWTALCQGLAVAMLVALGGSIGTWLPISVLAGIIVAVALHMFERDLLAWLRSPHTRLDALITIVVTVITVVYDLVSAIGVGVAIAIVLFLRAQIRAPVVHRRSTGANMRSVRGRTRAEREALDAHGERLVIYELRGNLFFATADRLYAELMPDLQRPAWVVLHMRRVGQVDLTGAKILLQMASQLRQSGGQLLFCNVHKDIGLDADVGRSFSQISPGGAQGVRAFIGLDEALEFAENALLTALGQPPAPSYARVPLEACDICQSMDAQDVAALEPVLQQRELRAGERVFSAGAQGHELYILLQGEVEVRLPTGARQSKRLALYGPGSAFGELAFLRPGPRAADAVALQDCALGVLDRTGFERLAAERPHAAIAVLLALGATQVEHQRWSTAEIARLAET